MNQKNKEDMKMKTEKSIKTTKRRITISILVLALQLLLQKTTSKQSQNRIFQTESKFIRTRIMQKEPQTKQEPPSAPLKETKNKKNKPKTVEVEPTKSTGKNYQEKPQDKISYNFSEPYFSNASLDQIEASFGPLNNTISTCFHRKNCEILTQNLTNPNSSHLLERIWRSNSSISGPIYSSQALSKSLVVGPQTRIIDFKNHQKGTEQPPSRPIQDPKVIIDCLYTKTSPWVCISGTDGSFFLFDPKTEKKVFNYANQSSVAYQSFSKISNHRCAVVGLNQEFLMCSGVLETESGVGLSLLDLRLPQASFKAYNGSINLKMENGTVEAKSYALDSSNEILGIMSIQPSLIARVYNFTSQEVLSEWSNPEAGLGNQGSFIHVKLGLVVVSQRLRTLIYDLSTGKQLHKLDSYIPQAEIGEIDHNLYYIDFNQTRAKFIKINITTPSNHSPGCLNYVYGARKCTKCQNGNLDKFGNCNHKLIYNNGNNIPGLNLNLTRFIDKNLYSVSFGKIDPNLLTVQFKPIEGDFDGLLRQKLVDRVLEGGSGEKNSSSFRSGAYSFEANQAIVVLCNREDKAWRQDLRFEFEPVRSIFGWRRGRVDFRVRTNMSLNGFEGDFGLVDRLESPLEVIVPAQNGKKFKTTYKVIFKGLSSSIRH